jgi:hypothetical protein
MAPLLIPMAAFQTVLTLCVSLTSTLRLISHSNDEFLFLIFCTAIHIHVHELIDQCLRHDWLLFSVDFPAIRGAAFFIGLAHSFHLLLWRSHQRVRQCAVYTILLLMIVSLYFRHLRYELDSDHVDSETETAKLRIGGPLGSSSMQLTPRDGLDPVSPLADEVDALADMDDDTEEYLPGDGDQSVEIKHRLRRRWVMRIAFGLVVATTITLFILTVTGFVLNGKASNAAAEVADVLIDVKKQYDLVTGSTGVISKSTIVSSVSVFDFNANFTLVFFLNLAAAPTVKTQADYIGQNYQLPAPEQMLIMTIVGNIQDLMKRAKAFEQQSFMLNPQNSGSLLETANSIRFQAVIVTLIVFLCVTFFMLLSVAHCYLRLKVEHEPLRTKYVFVAFVVLCGNGLLILFLR